MTLNPLSLIIPHETGGSRFGWHFIKSFKACEWRWFISHLAPHPDGTGIGTKSLTESGPIYTGSLTHAAVEAYYRSGWKDGLYDLAAALRAIYEMVDETCKELSCGREEFTKDIETARVLITAYDRENGPESNNWDYERWQVAASPDGEPLIEYPFDCPLGYGGYTFTSKVDMVVQDELGFGPFESKTCDVSRLPAERRRYTLDPQVTGEVWVLNETFPGVELTHPRINFIVKRRKAGDPVREVCEYTRTPEQLEIFRHDTIRTMKRIEEACELYQSLLDDGLPWQQAGHLAFDSSTTGEECGGRIGTGPCWLYETCAHPQGRNTYLRANTRARYLYPTESDNA